ncbi:MAG: hypothetical protein OEY56_14115, partial [Cyclobacteriaceae bacterium]|nr:hypothetical protein [Cyclobacteriaceae bacterium]
MEKEEYFGFLQTWEQIMWLLFYVSFGISLLIFFFYKIKYVAANEPKKKYDLASESESKAYLRSQYVMAMALFFLANTTYSETVQLSFIWIFIRGFISFCLATLYGYIAFLIFKYYYPKSLNKKLQVLRYTPRINPKTGNRMKLLSEDEEDAYLDEGMQAEENVFSIDYDV